MTSHIFKCSFFDIFIRQYFCSVDLLFSICYYPVCIGSVQIESLSNVNKSWPLTTPLETPQAINYTGTDNEKVTN